MSKRIIQTNKLKGLKVKWLNRDMLSQYWHNFTCADFINPFNFSTIKPFNRRRSAFAPAFTMAEILISLTIIGIIAAITLPALQANINESAWKAQRKALYSRMSQAISMMPSLNGYGDFTGEWADDVVTPSTDTAAARFVTDGLAKVLNINNICSIPVTTTNQTDRHKELAKCGIPDFITTMPNVDTGKTSKIQFPTKLSELNPMFTSTYIYQDYSYSNPQNNIDTNVAAFETKNGESIAVFYNPYCHSDTDTTTENYVQPYMCANFVYDLNGRKGPNKFGHDLGFITALYPTDSEVVAPRPLAKLAKNGTESTMFQDIAAQACRIKDSNSRVPNINELTAMFYNKQFLGITSQRIWSSSLTNTQNNHAWRLFFNSATKGTSVRTTPYYVWCVER